MFSSFLGATFRGLEFRRSYRTNVLKTRIHVKSDNLTNNLQYLGNGVSARQNVS